MKKERKKKWEEKVEIVRGSFLRSKQKSNFASDFYGNLFFLNPKIKKYFSNTDFEHQDQALLSGLNFLMGFLNGQDSHSRQQVLRIAHTHAKDNLSIHPHHYYYWIEALVMTVRVHDHLWYNDMEYYWREVISFPVTFIISQYFSPQQD
jgi:hemoglobin-like flavoprotein